ncbi:unnamed protein product [Rotaria sp. Silwood1]|nr:unnamed protein product [Rotaria sp. Silwood1]CAF1237617.1 unnamed protein product [Rotaria sp. Silwood1]CAF3504117.1 unnamed protein product [Rotaria sp. Silwood1]CAF3527946.1 unnamed protein product [Rotaria sp. Silwood1]CAF4533768.1 unnamed protein product [Rotaria sp. Silwood1]
MRSSQPVPSLVIDTCCLDGNLKPIKPPKQPTSNISRSWSLPNCNETYKDLCGAIHYTVSNHLNSLFKRSRSYPNNYLLTYSKLNEKKFHLQSPSTSIHYNINLLDPNIGTQTPSCLSSRYSLHGSFVDLSESGYYPPSDQQFIKSNNKLLTIDGRPLLIVDPFTRLSTNTYQDKCTDWLRRLNINST